MLEHRTLYVVFAKSLVSFVEQPKETFLARFSRVDLAKHFVSREQIGRSHFFDYRIEEVIDSTDQEMYMPDRPVGITVRGDYSDAGVREPWGFTREQVHCHEGKPHWIWVNVTYDKGVEVMKDRAIQKARELVSNTALQEAGDE